MKVGDSVTRDGTDIHRVFEIDEEGYCGTFECVLAPRSGWIKTGEKEYNLARRYTQIETE